jgi:hypothetical protein
MIGTTVHSWGSRSRRFRRGAASFASPSVGYEALTTIRFEAPIASLPRLVTLTCPQLETII